VQKLLFEVKLAKGDDRNPGYFKNHRQL